MKEINYQKKKAVAQVLKHIAKTGNPTCGQLLFLQLFFTKDVKEK